LSCIVILFIYRARNHKSIKSPAKIRVICFTTAQLPGRLPTNKAGVIQEAVGQRIGAKKKLFYGIWGRADIPLVYFFIKSIFMHKLIFLLSKRLIIGYHHSSLNHKTHE
jgi:hypothetical protein